MIDSTFWLILFCPPSSSTKTRITASKMLSLSLGSILGGASSLLASTKIVRASGQRGNFHLQVLLPPFLQELEWECQLTSSAILTASSPAMVTQRVTVTNASVKFSMALRS